MKQYTSHTEDVEPLEFSVNGETFTLNPQPVGGVLTAIFKMRNHRDADTMNMMKEALVWLGRSLSSDHEPWRGEPGHPDGADNPVEGCQGCRIEVMLADGTITPSLLAEIAVDMVKETSGRPPTKSTS